MPVHAHDCAECLEPERIAEAGKKTGSAVVMNDRFGDARAERGHALCKPLRNTAAMKRKIGSSGSFHLTIFLTHAADIKTGAEDHREQKEYRNQHYETIPQLLDHVFTSFGSTVRVQGGDT